MLDAEPYTPPPSPRSASFISNRQPGSSVTIAPSILRPPPVKPARLLVKLHTVVSVTFAAVQTPPPDTKALLESNSRESAVVHMVAAFAHTPPPLPVALLLSNAEEDSDNVLESDARAPPFSPARFDVKFELASLTKLPLVANTAPP